MSSEDWGTLWQTCCLTHLRNLGSQKPRNTLQQPSESPSEGSGCLPTKDGSKGCASYWLMIGRNGESVWSYLRPCPRLSPARTEITTEENQSFWGLIGSGRLESPGKPSQMSTHASFQQPPQPKGRMSVIPTQSNLSCHWLLFPLSPKLGAAKLVIRADGEEQEEKKKDSSLH